MDAFDFAQLQRIDRQADITVAGEPGTVMLIVRLVAEADVVLLDFAVTADIQNRRQRAFDISGR